MKPKASFEEVRGPRFRVLLLAAACNPYKGSESGLGWHRALITAQFFDTWVICGHWDQADIQRYLRENGEIPSLHFRFVKRWWLEDFLMLGRPLYEIHYLAHNLWHRRAFRLAASLHRELNFALVHQVSRSGFREPGYLWKLDAPFLWGPVGGTQNYPWRFLLSAGIRGALVEGTRSLVNWFQFRYSPRVLKAIKKARILIAANSKIKNDFERVHKVKSATTLLELGVERLNNGLSKGQQPVQLRILWSGKFKYHKALHLLLQALAHMPSDISYELRILGEGPLKRRWQRRAQRLGIDAHCHWLGWLPHEEAIRQFDEAHVLVFTSLRETTGTVVLEALSRGVPIICLDHQGVGEVITPECGLKIAVTTPQEVIVKLRQTIISLAKDRAKLRALSLGALERARQYLWSHSGKEMAKIYYAVLQGQDQGPP